MQSQTKLMTAEMKLREGSVAFDGLLKQFEKAIAVRVCMQCV